MKSVLKQRLLPGNIAVLWNYLTNSELLAAWLTHSDDLAIGTKFALNFDNITVQASVTKLINQSLIEFNLSDNEGKELGLLVFRLRLNDGRLELTIIDGSLPQQSFIDKLFYKFKANQREAYWQTRLNSLEYSLEQATGQKAYNSLS